MTHGPRPVQALRWFEHGGKRFRIQCLPRERLAVGRGDGGVIGALEGNVASTEVVLISNEILLAGG